MLTVKRIAPALLVMMVLLLAACRPAGSQVEQPTVSVTDTPAVAPTEAATAVIPTATTATEPTAAPTEAATATVAAPAGSLDEFIDRLRTAINERDFAAMQRLMADPFAVGYWLSEGVSYSPSEAAVFLESNMLPADAQIIWADPDTDLAPLLQGQPPSGFLGPDKKVAAALLSYGWGDNAGAEAIQFISEQPDGSYRWELMLVSGFGFQGLPTDVEAVVINADEATFRGGPGEEYEAVATVFGGLPYPVVGVSLDQKWWRLRCYDDNEVLIPSCWVSADPAVTSPTTLP